MRIVSVYLDEDLYAKLYAESKATKLSMSKIIKRALEEYFTRKEEKKLPSIKPSIIMHLQRAIELLEKL